MQTLVEKRREDTVEQEERREQEHIDALAHAKKACEGTRIFIIVAWLDLTFSQTPKD